ncbi:BBP7 family outer membrane beta-barrel protein [Planctomycetaceae bacterium]|nr:BBP7 family outer membrane beta-barrel protein [Planctomycetaceae bacterium]
MAIQILRSFLCIACLCSTGVGFAQSPQWGAGAGATYQTPYPPSQGYAPSGYAQFQGPPPGLMPTNYEQPLPGSREAIANGMFLPDQQVFPTDVGNQDRALDKYFRRIFDRTWIRIEALHWDIDNPHQNTLGADPIIDVTGNPTDPTVLQPVFDSTGILIGEGFTPILPDFSFNDNNGIRGTFGREDSWGSFQLSFMGLEESSESANFNEFLLAPESYITTTLDINGALSNAAVLFDEYYGVSYQTSLFAANSEFRVNMGQWPSGIVLQYIAGANFTQLHDNMRINGGYSNQGTEVLLESEIQSDIKNNMFGPVIGLNLEAEAPYGFSFGVTPKAILSINQIRYNVTTRDLTAIGDSVKHKENDYELSPILNLSVYAKKTINEHLSVYASWDVSWLTRVAQASNSIDYNDNTNTPQTDLGINKTLNGFRTGGITVGGEILLY